MAASGQFVNRTYIELPPSVATQIIQTMQEDSAVMALAQKTDLPGWGTTIPMITSDPEPEWVSETGLKPVKAPGLSKKVMQGYTLSVIVPFSNQFRRDTTTLFNACVARLPRALSKKIDGTVFHGDAPGSNFDTLKSVTAQSLTSNVYAGLVAADMDIATHDGELNGFVLSPVGRGVLLNATDQNKRPLFINSVAEGAVPVILGRPVKSSRAAYKAGTSPAEDVIGFAGDWTQAQYGIVEGVKIDISDQATLTYTDDNSQTVTINLWQQNMFAVRAEIEFGFVANTAVFNKLTAAPTGATGATGETA